MEIDVSISGESLSINVENPYRFDVKEGAKDIADFGTKTGVDVSTLNIGDLLARMIKGVAGCEHGCPADAKSLVYKGFGSFKLQYVDGGILSARSNLSNGKNIEIKVFPGF